MILGIDIGGTTTDVVAFSNQKILDFFSVSANDAITSAAGALGKFVATRKLKLSDIESIAVTGVGSNAIDSEIFGVPVAKVDEFKAIGLGGLYLSGLERSVVVSLGTGTAIVYADGLLAEHLGGTGVGGGTLVGLAKYMINVTDIDTLIELAQKGSLENVDLSIGDIAQSDLGKLPAEATASNFGKHNDKASQNDLALGIINLVCQTIGMLAVFASRQKDIPKVVLTGKVVRLPQSKKIFSNLKSIFDIDFIIPQKAEYATAVGAAYALMLKNDSY